MEDRRNSAIIGGVALLVIVSFVWLLFLYIGGSFKSGYEVDATFSRAGQLLRDGSDVKMRGVLVGSVTGINVDRQGKARVTMLLDEAHEVPSNIEAAIRAKTLFGEKFIDFVPPRSPEGRLREGDDIPEDRTIPPIEVETILEKGVPILEAVDPEAFGAGLHALAEGLVGNEDGLRRATVQSEKLLTETERTLPNLERNLVHLRNFASALNQTDTDLLNALEGLTLVGQVLREHPEGFRKTVTELAAVSSDLGDVVVAREKDLGILASEQLAVLQEVRERKDKLPALVRVLDGFLGVWVADLSEGPYWRISVTDPPIVLGEPYAPGTAPSPRTRALAQLDNDTTPVDEVLRVLLETVPDEEIEQTTDELADILGRLR